MTEQCALGWGAWAEWLQPPEGPQLCPCEGRGLTCQGTDARYRPGGRRQGPPGATETSVDGLVAQSSAGGSSGPAPSLPRWSPQCLLVITHGKDAHSLRGASGGRSRSQREEPGVSHMGQLWTIRWSFQIWPRQVGLGTSSRKRWPWCGLLHQHLPGGQRQELSRFRKTFPGPPSD